MTGKTKIFLVDDHTLFRDGLKFMLNQSDEFTTIGEASTGLEFLEKLSNLQPQLILMDIVMPGMNGVTATQKALQIQPDLKILALSMSANDEHFFEMFRAGACGLVKKNACQEELFAAIRQVMEGTSCFPIDMTRRFIEKLSSIEKQPVEGPVPRLSKREKTILNMISSGLSNKEISDRISISTRTVDSIRSALIRKTGASNSLNLVIYAYRNNLLEF